MKIENVELFYLAMPQIKAIGDGSQDALLVRVEAGAYVGWGECEAAPLPSIAGFVCPLSHSACRPVRDSVLGQRLDSLDDIERISRLVHENSLDLLQTDHILSGIEIALWDLLGKRFDEPVYRLLGYQRAFPKTPYASQLFGATAEETLQKGKTMRARGYRAAKFGWGPFGHGSVAADAEQLAAAREGLGEDGILLVDAGTVWRDDIDAAARRIAVLEQTRTLWLEEPFVSGALEAYQALARRCKTVQLAGGEGCHNVYMARHMLDHAGLGFIQIDSGRIGGIGPARQIAGYAAARDVTYVNHTFTSHLALSASLQPYAGLRDHEICEYPVELKPLAAQLTEQRLLPDENGQLHVPDKPGLGMTISVETLVRYLVDVEIKVGAEILYRTPAVPS